MLSSSRTLVRTLTASTVSSRACGEARKKIEVARRHGACGKSLLGLTATVRAVDAGDVPHGLGHLRDVGGEETSDAVLKDGAQGAHLACDHRGPRSERLHGDERARLLDEARQNDAARAR